MRILLLRAVRRIPGVRGITPRLRAHAMAD